MRWNTQNMLRSNADKTEVMLFTSRFTTTPNIEGLSFGNTVIELNEQVCDLGVNLDKNLSLAYHINETCQKQLTPLGPQAFANTSPRKISNLAIIE